jgi:hypothetical protein
MLPCGSRRPGPAGRLRHARLLCSRRFDGFRTELRLSGGRVRRGGRGGLANVGAFSTRVPVGGTMVASIIVPKEDVMESVPLLDCAGRRRSPATLSDPRLEAELGELAQRHSDTPDASGQRRRVYRAATGDLVRGQEPGFGLTLGWPGRHTGAPAWANAGVTAGCRWAWRYRSLCTSRYGGRRAGTLYLAE